MNAAPELDHVRIVNACRLELEAAGNPSYVVVVVDEARTTHIAPIVFSTVGPASDHAARLARAAFDTGEQILIVSRQAAGGRAIFAVMEPRTLRKLHQRTEVIETSLADSDGQV